MNDTERVDPEILDAEHAGDFYSVTKGVRKVPERYSLLVLSIIVRDSPDNLIGTPAVGEGHVWPLLALARRHLESDLVLTNLSDIDDACGEITAAAATTGAMMFFLAPVNPSSQAFPVAVRVGRHDLLARDLTLGDYHCLFRIVFGHGVKITVSVIKPATDFYPEKNPSFGEDAPQDDGVISPYRGVGLAREDVLSDDVKEQGTERATSLRFFEIL